MDPDVPVAKPRPREVTHGPDGDPLPLSRHDPEASVFLSWIVAVAGGALAIGSAMTWATVDTAYGASTLRGLDRRAGVILFVFGCLIAFTGVRVAFTRQRKAWATAFVLGAISALVAVSIMLNPEFLVPNDRGTSIYFEASTVTIGPGLWVCAIAAMVATLAAVAIRVKRPPATVH